MAFHSSASASASSSSSSSSSPAADLLAAAAAAAASAARNDAAAVSTSTTTTSAMPRKGVRGNKRARLVCMRCHEKKIKCDLQHSTAGPDHENAKCTRCDLAGYECRIRLSKRGSGNQSSRRASTAAATATTYDNASPATTTATAAVTSAADNNAIPSMLSMPAYDHIPRHPHPSSRHHHATISASAPSSRKPSLLNPANGRDVHAHAHAHAHLQQHANANNTDTNKRNASMMIMAAAAAAANDAAGYDSARSMSSDDEREGRGRGRDRDRDRDPRRSPASLSNGSRDSRYSPTNISAPAPANQLLLPATSIAGGVHHGAGPGSGSGPGTRLPSLPSLPSHLSSHHHHHPAASAAAAHRRYSEAVNFGYPSTAPAHPASATAAAAGHNSGYPALNLNSGNGNGTAPGTAPGSGPGPCGVYGSASSGSRVTTTDAHAHAHAHAHDHTQPPDHASSSIGGAAAGVGAAGGASTGGTTVYPSTTTTLEPTPALPGHGHAHAHTHAHAHGHVVYPGSGSGSAYGLATHHAPAPGSAYGQQHQHPGAAAAAAVGYPYSHHPHHPGYLPGYGAPAQGLKREYDEYDREAAPGAMMLGNHTAAAQGYPPVGAGHYRDGERESRKRGRDWDHDRERDREHDFEVDRERERDRERDPGNLLNVLNHPSAAAAAAAGHALPPPPYHPHPATYDHDRILPPLHSTYCNSAAHHHSHPHPHPHQTQHTIHPISIDPHHASAHIHTPASSQCQSACPSRTNSSTFPLPPAAAAAAAAAAMYDLPPPILQESFAETYFEYAYTWCPTIDRASLLTDPRVFESPLLKQALALLGSRVEPPVMQHATPAQYYERVKQLFNAGVEKDAVVALQALTLVYWWGAAPAPGTVSMDTVWWWTGVAIRLAQQVGLHREAPASASASSTTSSAAGGLKRRIWWTLFARERFTSMCEGRPCIIDPADCTVKEPSVADFPDTVDLLKAQAWVNCVKLSAIVGRVAKYRVCKTEDTRFPGHLARELIDWVQSLPEALWLPISGDRNRCNSGAAAALSATTGSVAGIGFNRDIHQLYLPYLSAITLLYLTRSSQPLAKGYTTAILSAACVARIFEDFLARRSVRFLQGLAGWHVAIAILALLHGRRIKQLTEECDRNIALLRIALKEIAKLWPSAHLFDVGFEQAVRSEMFAVPVAPLMTPPLQAARAQAVLGAQAQAQVQMQMAAQVSPTTVVPPVTQTKEEEVDGAEKEEEKKDGGEPSRGDITDGNEEKSASAPEPSSNATATPEESGVSGDNSTSTSITPEKKEKAEEEATTASSPAAASTSEAAGHASIAQPSTANASTSTETPHSASPAAAPAPVPAPTQITLPPMALHPPPPPSHPRPPRPGCNSSLSELADVATGTLVNWLDFFPFATRETSPLVDVLLANSRAGTLEFDGVDWPVSDMSLMLNDLLSF